MLLVISLILVQVGHRVEEVQVRIGAKWGVGVLRRRQRRGLEGVHIGDRADVGRLLRVFVIVVGVSYIWSVLRLLR